MRRVVITGIGAVTPIGNTFEQSWEAAVGGRSGIRNSERSDVSSLPWTSAGEVTGFDPSLYLSPREELRIDPFVRFAVAASIMASEDAGLEKGPLLESGGIIMGSSRGGISTLEKAVLKDHEAAMKDKRQRLSPYLMPSTTISAGASFPAWKLGIKGYCLGISNACSSGANAIGEAFRLIRSGYGGPVFAGGSEAPLCRTCIQGYGAAGALSDIPGPSASRPFDSSRRGFVMSEGACVLILEDLESALKRGADVYAEIIGYSCLTDAFHMTKPDEKGEIRAIRAALDQVGVSTGEVDYISAHGTATVIGDRTEAAALRMVFGKVAERIPMSALKSMTGHMLAASGAFEAAAAAMTLKTGIIPPTINLESKDSLCNLNIVRKKTVTESNIAVSTSFGFGGVNAVLVLKRY